MNALQKIAEWVATSSAENYPHQWEMAENWALISLVDTMGCIISGSDHPASQQCYKTVADWGLGPATAIGYSQKLAPPWAAMVNGTSGHSLDFNAWDGPTASNSSPVMWAALLAVAEAENNTGAEMIDAFIIGMEITMRLGEAVNLAHYHMGWHTTSTLAALGAAAGCARLLRLDEARCAHALSIATSHVSGYKSQFGTPMKLIHSGMGAKTGVMSAYLAQKGITGTAEALDGPHSFLTLHSREDAPGFEKTLSKLGKRLALAEHGIVIKPYPSCAYTHRSIDGLIDLQAEYDFSAEDVAHITAQIPFFNASILKYPDPQDDTQARFSMEYCLAVALKNHSVLPKDFEKSAIFDEHIRKKLSLVSLDAHPQSSNSSDLSAVEPAIITVNLHNGTVLEKRVDHSRGMPQRPFTKIEIENKFNRLVDKRLELATIEHMLKQLWKFEQVANVSDCLEPLKVKE